MRNVARGERRVGVGGRATPAQMMDARADRSGGPDACWPWKGTRDRDGYGKVWCEGRTWRATHLAMTVAGRPVPEGMWALHRCDNPPCVNPAHLFAGTHRDNMIDAASKGRCASPSPQARAASRATKAKFTDSQVLEMRAMWDSGLFATAIARKFGADNRTVWYCLHTGWKHLPETTRPRRRCRKTSMDVRHA